MSRVSRGGQTLKTGKIGRVNCLRQQVMMPGERMNMSLEGTVRLESLRERDVMRINAHLATFMTPIRWLWPEFPDYVKEGPNTLKTMPVESWFDLATLGLGASSQTLPDNIPKYMVDSYLRIYNEWYKHPENPDIDKTAIDAGDELSGAIAVPLSKTWSRMRFDATPDDSDQYTQAAVSEFDVRDLSEMQAKFRSSMKRDVLTYNRWMELVKDTWNGDGSREVDQVPIMLDQVEVGVNPREMPATDGASLGQWQSLFDFNIDHQIPGIVAPEHCIITTLLTVRFSAALEGRHPLANDRADWFTVTADPEVLSSRKPVPVERRDLFIDTASATELGYLPAGWQWRADHDVISYQIDTRDSFPYSLIPTTQAETKDATRVKDAFRSQALGDYIVDCFVKEESKQPIGDSMDSYFSGMTDHVKGKVGGRNQEFPKGGKQL